MPAPRREAQAPRPPPTLPRMYIELEPRQLTDADVPLTDYADEPIGLLSDFHVSWRLQVRTHPPPRAAASPLRRL